MSVFRGKSRIYGDLAWMLRARVQWAPLGAHVVDGTVHLAYPQSKNRWRREPDGRWSVERSFST